MIYVGDDSSIALQASASRTEKARSGPHTAPLASVTRAVRVSWRNISQVDTSFVDDEVASGVA